MPKTKLDKKAKEIKNNNNKKFEDLTSLELQELAKAKLISEKPKVWMTINGIDVMDSRDSIEYSRWLAATGKLNEASGNSIFDDKGNVVDSGARVTFINPESYFGYRFYQPDEATLQVLIGHKYSYGFKNGNLPKNCQGYEIKLDKDGNIIDESIVMKYFTNKEVLKNFGAIMQPEEGCALLIKLNSLDIQEEQPENSGKRWGLNQ